MLRSIFVFLVVAQLCACGEESTPDAGSRLDASANLDAATRDDGGSRVDAGPRRDGSGGDSDVARDAGPPPDLPVRYDRALYEEALSASVRFYGAQRCGDGHNWTLADNPSGQSCHLEDGPALRAGLDLSGGWHDAGDFIKFTLTNAWSAYSLLKAHEVFPDVFPDVDGADYGGAPNGVPDLLDEVRYATDYLLAAHPDASTLVRRVGGDQDHDLWVTSPYQSSLSVSEGGGRRPVFDGANADIAGIAAAALALASQSLRPYDPAYADRCLSAAESLYRLGLARQRTTPDNYYPDSSWQDAMLCGAAELYRATGEADYLADARRWDTAVGSHGWVVGWDQNADYCRHSLARAGDTEVVGRWRADVDRYLDSISAHPETTGLAYFLEWGSLRFALGAAFSAALFYDVSADDRYRDFAISQLDYALGDNGYGRSFVVGVGTDSPTRPHHKNAHGHDALDWDLIAPHRHVLRGALVGGPTQLATGPSLPGYRDDIQDFVGNEVTIDYNTGLVGTAAFVVWLYAR